MTFLQRFPSLKGKRTISHISCLTGECDDDDYSYTQGDVNAGCLDKQRVREAFNNPKNLVETNIGWITDGMAVMKELGL